MEVIYGKPKEENISSGTVCAMGFFDGVHLGHQVLIDTAVKIAKEKGLKSMVYTFREHPLTVLDADNAPRLITDNVTKTDIFKLHGVDMVNFNPVDKEYLGTSPIDFLERVLVKQYNVRAIIAGFNFRFGYGGEGTSGLLSEFGRKNNIDVHIVKPVEVDGITVSSTVIRNYISSGNIKMANKLMGRKYSMHGEVIHGMERGRKMGFPTANIRIGETMAIPKNGVYVTRVKFDGSEMTGVTNVGLNPTFMNEYLSVETHILGYNGDLYGKAIELRFYDYIRNEKPFKNMYELSVQIKNDCSNAENYFR